MYILFYKIFFKHQPFWKQSKSTLWIFFVIFFVTFIRSFRKYQFYFKVLINISHSKILFFDTTSYQSIFSSQDSSFELWLTIDLLDTVRDKIRSDTMGIPVYVCKS